ncbi:MMPL family transporter [Streptosporangium sp. NBC_01495]|uniref:MMPL family transporter n=1 Tax=Streptosporangium sp. NBC_01495 TaxID=2903899 RepID=UPI002E36FD5A|nr:MMPL family transporter [Streptosporangium sp. NBC_01495]
MTDVARFAVRMARWSATHPWQAIVGWILFVAICITAGSLAGTRGTVDSDFWTGESGRTQEIIATGGFPNPPVENVLITARTGTLDKAAADAAAQDVTRRMDALPEVAEVGSPIPSPDGQALLVTVTMRADQQSAVEHVTPLLDATAATQSAYRSLRVEQTGGVTIDSGIFDQVAKDLVLAELLTAPVTLVILLIAFGVFVAAAVPLILAISSIVAAIGLSALASHVFPDVGMVNNIILLMGMAVGVDYSLFYVKREREERAKSGGKLDYAASVELAAATSGHAILVSAFAVIVSMMSLYLGGIAVFSSLATGSVIVVAVAMVGSLTVLPALLAKLGRRLDSPRVPFFGRFGGESREPRMWRAMLRPALRHPALTFLVATVAMLALALPALNLKLTAAGLDTMPRQIVAMQTYDRLTEAFPSEGAAHVVAVRAEAAQAGQVGAALRGIVQDLQGSPLFVPVPEANVRASTDGRVHTIDLATPYTADTAKAAESLRRLKEVVAARMGTIPGADHAVGGDVAKHIDEVDIQTQRMPWVVGFVLLLTLLIMVAAFRSLVVAVTAILLNMLSAAAAFGVLVAVFQYEWAEQLLDFRSNGAIISWVPLFLFVVLFGLSMDYHVFLVSRIKEAAEREGVTTRQAVADGIVSSAGVVTSAAVIMVSVFVCFVFPSMVELKQLGLSLAVAVLLDAVVIRILVLPSLMVMLGRFNWWPSRLGRTVAPEPTPEERPRVTLLK